MKKIKELNATGQTYQTNEGKTMYKQRVVFDDNSSGFAWSMSQTPPYAVGDDVEVTVTGNDKDGSQKLKVKKPSNFAPQQGGQGKSFMAPPGSLSETDAVTMIQKDFDRFMLAWNVVTADLPEKPDIDYSAFAARCVFPLEKAGYEKVSRFDQAV